MVVDCGVCLSLHANCHYQNTYARFNLNIHHPPPYNWCFWDYKKANFDHIKQDIEGIDWEWMFISKSVNEQVSFFNEFILNISDNYVPNKFVTISD